MEMQEHKVTHLYEYVQRYRYEHNISMAQWSTEAHARALFWEWLKRQKDSVPMLVLFGLDND